MSISRKHSVLIIGIDGMCPRLFEDLEGSNELPVLSAFMRRGEYGRLRVTVPPQSPVSWTTITTGLNPGYHGIFDFIQRNPKTYIPDLALFGTKKTLMGMQYTSTVKAETLFESAAKHGISSTVIRWPLMFPVPKINDCRILPGLGVPDIKGGLGLYSFYTTDPTFSSNDKKGKIFALVPANGDQFQTHLYGPMVAGARGSKEVSVPMTIGRTSSGVKIGLPSGGFELEPGQWGPQLSERFSIGFMMKTTGTSRAYLQTVEPYLNLFFLPLQIYPKESLIPLSSPPSFASELWDACGPYLTLGMPEDTNGLNDGCITEEGFLQLCEHVLAERERMIHHSLRSFDQGVFACVFDTLDRVQHMFLKTPDPDGRYRNIVKGWYRRLDSVVGRILDKVDPKTHVLILSDHGFSPFQYNVHLNSWLVRQGYMNLIEEASSGRPLLKDVDWSNTKAYALGLNGIYLNLKGREGRGVVDPEEAPTLKVKLAEKLQQWHHTNGLPVMQRAHLSEEVFEGDYSSQGPDLVAGFNKEFRASRETAIGSAPAGSLVEENHQPWGADHCCDPTFVPGVVFCSEKILPSQPSVYDIRPAVSSLLEVPL